MTKKNLIAYLILSVVLLGVLGVIFFVFGTVDSNYQRYQPDSEMTSGWIKYTQPAGLYSFHYPDTFTFKQVDQNTIEVISSTIPEVQSNFKLSLQHAKLNGNQTLSEIIRNNQWCLTLEPQNGQLLEIDGKEGLLFEDSLCGPSGSTVIYTKSNNNVYLITIESPVSYKKIGPFVEPLLKTFSFM